MGIIIVVGLARSGKDTVGDYIAQKYGYAKHNFSDVLKEMLIEKNIEPTKQHMLELGNMLREEMGMDAVAKMLDRKIKGTEKLVLVGPRSIEEIDYFRKKNPDLKIIKVVARKEDRFERKSEADPKGEEEFFQRDAKDAEQKGLNKVLEAADLQINNFGNIEELKKETDTAMQFVVQ